MGRPFIVQLPNRPDELGHLARALAARGVTIVHIAGCGSGERCCALLTTGDEASTEDVLRSMGLEYDRGDCVTIEVSSTQAATDELTSKLAAAGVHVLRHCVCSRGEATMQLGLAVDDAPRAREVLGLADVVEVVGAKG